MKKTLNHRFLHSGLRINAFNALQILDNLAWVGVIISPKVMYEFSYKLHQTKKIQKNFFYTFGLLQNYDISDKDGIILDAGKL